LLEEDEKNHTEPKRSIGIISLFNEAQARLIDTLLDADEYISARKDKHNIRCGTARGFQGDEKDIILLSLVIGFDERRLKSDDMAGYNVAVSRARYSITLFYSRSEAKLQADDVRKKLLKYFAEYKNRKQKALGKFPVLISLANNLGLVGYTVMPIPMSQGFMIQVGSDGCETSCVFVFLGAVKKWEGEQEICYMLSRLNTKWKAVWLFDANVRPDQCLEEMKKFLKINDVTPADAVASDSDKEEVEGGGNAASSAKEVAASSKRESSQEAGEKQGLGDDSDFHQDPKRRRTDGGDDSDQVDPSRTLSPVPAQAAPLSSGSAFQTPVRQENDVSTPVLHFGQPTASDVQQSEGGAGGKSVSVEPSAEVGGDRKFSFSHLADVLTASASGTLQAMVSHVQKLKAKDSPAFKDLKQSENGIRYKQEDIPKMAKSIAECRPDGATNAQELLSWLTVSAT
jgi:hypothetical protein